jgi:RND family efflux transporter MFP subunit
MTTRTPLTFVRFSTPLTASAIFILAAGVFFIGAHAHAADPAPAAKVKPALTVTTTQARANSVPVKLAANGSVAAWQEASVGSEAVGLRVQELHVNVGDVVKRGQLLATYVSDSIKADVAQSQAALNEAQANAAEAMANAERARALTPSGALSKQQITQYLTAENAAKARVASAQAALDAQQLRLKNTQVFAPDSGIISAKIASVGAVVGSGGELYKLIRQGRLEWRAEVPSASLSEITVGKSVSVIAPNGVTLKGKVRTVAPTVDAQTRSGLVYVDLTTGVKELAAFKAGMFARGEFELGSANGLTIPQQAIVVRDGFNYVFRVNADNRVSQIKLKVGRRIKTEAGEQVEVLEGITANTAVVASGAGFLNDGDVVKVVPAASTPVSK